MKRLCLTTALCLCLGPNAFGQTPTDYRVPRAAAPPKLDGILDDQVWTQAPMQPNQHLSQSVEFSRNRFWRPESGAQIYAVNIVNSRTTYQFDKHFLVRMLARYDSSQRRVLTDFLGSYEFVPGTVFHAGYGALYQKGFGSTEPVPGLVNPNDSRSRYLMMNRGLFVKASYLRRF